MWKMYDDLISLVPRDLMIRDYLAGASWNLVRAHHVGMAMTPREGPAAIAVAGNVRGMRATDSARYLKSWSNHEAALGLATINSAVNTLANVESLQGFVTDARARASIFDFMLEETRGKKVAVVGHFRGLEAMASQCRLSILERLPGDGDLPDPACEFILPEQDYVFITATTLINKTLPRLLELSRQATVALVGPSTPLTPVLFEYGIDILAGTIVVDSERVWNLIQEGDQHRFFSDGASRMVKIDRRRTGKPGARGLKT